MTAGIDQIERSYQPPCTRCINAPGPRVPLNNADMSLRDLKRAATRRASQWMARPLQEAQHRRCALQASPCGAYRCARTLR